jgi:hypothetical protein
MNFQITEAPTKEMASGRNTSDFARVPHQILSVRTAITRPKNVQAAGTTNNQSRLFKIELRNWGSPNAH